ncbi:hypothetical protein GLX27_003639 [Malassezia furfur]|uniref:Uncharacterized protein n=1 Tax=Malassezia furfur TaxID=55194 RepID=A0ABY8EU73_MALFU|nr:hypothetical protein CBS14141_003261 [Malassezia furfur]WFD48966.1 hypothetical protein GLX27_003639 [Malassezia furfur]
MDGSLEPLPVALWEHPPPFVFSVPVQTLGIGVVFAIATVMTVNLTFTAPYHYPLSKCNYILQLTAAFLFLITVATSLSIMVHTLATRAAQEPHLFPYLPETLPSRDWTLAQQVLFLLMQAVSVSMANVRVALTQFTHIQFLTLLFPSKLEMRLIVWLMSPVVLAQFGLFFMFYVEDVGAEIQDICECTLSLLYTAALVIWGTLINRQRAWRRDGATALFGTATIVMALIKTLVSYIHMAYEDAYWILLVSWALTIWQSWLGFWWWVSAGMGIGEVEDRLRRQERARKRYYKRRTRKARADAAAAAAAAETAATATAPKDDASQQLLLRTLRTLQPADSEHEPLSPTSAPSAAYDTSVPATDGDVDPTHSTTDHSSSNQSTWVMRVQQTLGRFLPASATRRIETLRHEHQRGVLNAALKQVDAYQSVVTRAQAARGQALRDLRMLRRKSARVAGGADDAPESGAFARLRRQDRTTYE